VERRDAAGVRRAVGLAACWLVLVFELAAGPAGATDRVTAGCSRGWHIRPSPNADRSSNLIDVAWPGDGSPWAVGFSLPPGDGFATVAMRYTGRSWQVVPTPNPDPQSNRLDAVDGSSDHDLWAAGSASLSTLVEHWDGSAWSVVPSPNLARRINDLQGVSAAAPGDALVVGSAQTLDASSVVSLIEHWDGTRWSVVPSPDPGDYNFLADVAARSPTDAWAVGSTFDATGWRNLILHWDGASWTRIDAPSPGLEDNNLEAVVVLGPDDAWAVGHAADSGVSSRTPVTLHWNGTAWALVPGPDLSGQLNSVAADPDGSLWAAGYREVPPTTLIERWGGSAWRVVRSQNRQGVIDNALFGVAVGPGGAAWTVGSSATSDGRLQSLVERPCR
jgi:hypothetical protein